MTSSTYISTHISGTMLSLRNPFKPPWPNPEDSICDKHNWHCPVKGKNCWSIRGPALQAYNTIRERIKQCLTERERDLYEGQDESSLPHWIDCLMVGRIKARARPYIIISCGQERFCKKLMGIMKESIWWREFDQNYQGFGGFLLLRYAPRRLADANADARQNWVYTSDRFSSLCGAPIFFADNMLASDSACAPQQATLGNIIYLDGQPFGLTVAHPLVEQGFDNAPYQHTQHSDAVFYMDDSGDESSPNLCSTSSSASEKVDVSEVLPSEQFVRPQPLEGSPRLLGRLIYSSEGTPGDGVDWALIAFTQDRNSHLQESTATIGTYLDDDGHPIAVPTPKTVACPAGNPVPVFTTSGQNRLIKGILSANESLVCLSGPHQYLSLHSVILTDTVIPGDCGKWVFDYQGNWYGHMVAGIPWTRIAYIALASQIVDDIRRRVGISSFSLKDAQVHELVDQLTSMPQYHRTYRPAEPRSRQAPTEREKVPGTIKGGEVFEIEGSWYISLGGNKAKPISAREARDLGRTPRKTTSTKIPASQSYPTPLTSSKTNYPYQRNTRHYSISRTTRNEPLDSANDYLRQDPQSSRGLLSSSHQNVAPKPSKPSDDISQPPQPTASDDLYHPNPRRADQKITPPSKDKSVGDEDDDIIFTAVWGTLRQFVNIPEDDFGQRARFIIGHPEVLRSKPHTLLEEAVSQIMSDNETAARQCIVSMIVLNVALKLNKAGRMMTTIAREICAIQIDGSDQEKDFRPTFDNALAKAMDLAALKRPRRATSSAPGSDITLVNESSDGRHTQLFSDKVGQLTIKEQLLESQKRAEELLERLSSALPGGSSVPRTIDPNEFPNESMRKLSTSYKLVNNGQKYFVKGRVFSLLWHEPLTLSMPKAVELEERDKIDPRISIGPYGEKIFSCIRRMVVIRNRHGYCWCLAINSYGGLGLKKRGFKTDDIEAHAIIYDCQSKPQILDEEPRTSKRPIAVEMAPGQALSAASRLHYGQPYVVQWRTRVMDVGMVRPECMDVLTHEAANELFGGDLRQ